MFDAIAGVSNPAQERRLATAEGMAERMGPPAAAKLPTTDAGVGAEVGVAQGTVARTGYLG